MSTANHPDMVFVLTEGVWGKVRYYRTVAEFVKAIALGHGQDAYEASSYQKTGRFAFGRATVMFLDRPGADITHLVEPFSRSVYDYNEQQGPQFTAADLFLQVRGVAKDPQKAATRKAFLKQVRDDLTLALQRELGL